MTLAKDKTTRFRVTEPSELMAFLIKKMSDVSRSDIKKLLARGQVSVNEVPVTRYNHALRKNDSVVVHYSKRHIAFSHPQVHILYEDDDVIVIDKKEGLLSVTIGREHETTAFEILLQYLKAKDLRSRLFVVHRLDRETSGVMMFAKNKDFQTEIQRRWHENVVERKYVALVEGMPDPKKGRIVSYLSENPKSLKMRSDNRDSGGQKAVTNYIFLSSNGAYSLLEISLETGRKNQIRIHMQQMGHSVAGDKKYGGLSNPINRMGLHASVLAWRHPFTNTVYRFESPVPKKFAAFIGLR